MPVKSKVKPKAQVPRWANRIWCSYAMVVDVDDGSLDDANQKALPVHPRDAEKLHSLIEEHGPLIAATAWLLYVTNEPPLYRLAASKHVHKFTSRKGNECIEQYLDTGSITKFPLASFLAVADGYITSAADLVPQFGTRKAPEDLKELERRVTKAME
jgi:hypothetical protein